MGKKSHDSCPRGPSILGRGPFNIWQSAWPEFGPLSDCASFLKNHTECLILLLALSLSEMWSGHRIRQVQRDWNPPPLHVSVTWDSLGSYAVIESAPLWSSQLPVARRSLQHELTWADSDYLVHGDVPRACTVTGTEQALNTWLLGERMSSGCF